MAKFLPWRYVAGQPKHVEVAAGPTPNPKKMTGSRLGAVAGLDKWKSPFEAWCAICRVGEQPFEGNKFTEAGNAIEPKLIAWCKENVSPYVYTPFEWFGKTTQEMGYDHFPNEPMFGGMWDAIVLDAPLGKGKPVGYVEAKTSSRPQDWTDGVPSHYAVQGLSYGALDHITKVFVPVAMLEPEDYDHPEDFVCTDDNTFLYELDTETWEHDGRSIKQIIGDAQGWWVDHVSGNNSPEFDEKADKAILAVLRKTEVKSDDLEALAKQAALLEGKIELLKAKAGLPALEKTLKALKDQVKVGIIEKFTPNDEVVSAYGWKVKKSQTETVDKEELRADGLDKYIHTETMYRLTKDTN